MIFLKYLSGVANLLQKYLLKCYFWNIWAVWPIYCRNICCDNIFEIFELCDQNPAGHERSVQLKQKIEIKSRYKKKHDTRNNILAQGMNGAFHSNGGDTDRALNHLDPGMLRFSCTLSKLFCLEMYLYHDVFLSFAKLNQKIYKRWEGNVVLAWHSHGINPNQSQWSPSPFPPTFAHFCAAYKSAHCNIVFWKLHTVVDISLPVMQNCHFSSGD